ncbi:MAG: alpha-galactosidase, partial [Mobilitalea sp.]
MPIIFDKKNGQFHLYNDQISYIFKVMENNQLEHLFFGKRVSVTSDYSYLSERGHRDMQACSIEGNVNFSLEHIRQEYPTYGTGDMRYPAYEIEREDGSHIVDFQYESHTIYFGKKRLEQLPATYVEKDCEAATLEITLYDSQIKSKIVLFYTIYEQLPVITRHTEFYCEGEEAFTLETAMSMSIDMPDKDYKLLDLAGAWARERHVRVKDIDYGVQSIYSMRGCSSHQFNPFMALMRPDTNEDSGEVIGVSLIYSGDFLAQVEVDNFNVSRIMIGIHPNEFRWKLKKNEKFVSPEAVMVYTEHGLNDMSQVFHKLYRTRLSRGIWRDKERPILINNWEATYFNFTEEKILSIAEKAAEVGIELFVLDDGWFGKRNDCNSSLGDWFPNEAKIPGGIKNLADKINQMGLKFGLWFEPEMVNEDSDLYREHPDWVLGDRRRYLSKARGQYVLDFSKEEVVKNIYGKMKKILSEAPIDYVKWDLNRSMTEVFSQGGNYDDQGKVRHNYILGVYSLFERLTNEFPHILFESCASGGARFDPGMLYYAPQAWASDDTDAVERIKIQYGSSIVYPISSIGSHVSAIPNKQVFRNESLNTRAAVAYFGTFGYELDITQLIEEDLEIIRRQITFMKKYRTLIQMESFYRLRSPFDKDGNTAAWMVVSEDLTEAMIAYYR